MVKYIEDHPFTGSLLQLDDTPENRQNYRFYFHNGYHHYYYECKGVYTNGHDGGLAHTYPVETIIGFQKIHEIEHPFDGDKRCNIPVAIMRIAASQNKNHKGKLKKFEEDYDEPFTLPRPRPDSMVSCFLLDPEGESL